MPASWARSPSNNTSHVCTGLTGLAAHGRGLGSGSCSGGGSQPAAARGLRASAADLCLFLSACPCPCPSPVAGQRESPSTPGCRAARLGQELEEEAADEASRSAAGARRLSAWAALDRDAVLAVLDSRGPKGRLPGAAGRRAACRPDRERCGLGPEGQRRRARKRWRRSWPCPSCPCCRGGGRRQGHCPGWCRHCHLWWHSRLWGLEAWAIVRG